MTAYFDDIDARIRKLRDAPDQGEYDAIEDTLVNDATIASEFPEFPEDLRDEVRKAILRFGIESLPEFVAKPEFVLNPGEDAEHEYQECLHALSSALHTIFHEVGNRNIQGISDDPRTWPRLLLYRGSVARGHIAEIKRWGNVRAEAEARGWHANGFGDWVDEFRQRRVWISYDDVRWRCSLNPDAVFTAEAAALHEELVLAAAETAEAAEAAGAAETAVKTRKIKPPLPAWFDSLVKSHGEDQVRKVFEFFCRGDGDHPEWLFEAIAGYIEGDRP